MKPARTVLQCLTVATVLAAGAIDVFAADEAFKNGIEARQKRDWAGVETQMLQAIKENGKESTRVLSVGGFLGIRDVRAPYLPYFYLGEALFSQNRCVPAMDAWAVSQQQGIVAGHAEPLRILQEGMASCESQGYLRPEDYTQALSSGSKQLTDVRAKAQGVTRYGSENEPVWRGRPEWDDRLKRATTLIDQAQKELEGGRVSHRRENFQRSTLSVSNATEALESLDREFRASVAATVQTAQRREKEQSLTTAIGEAQELRQRLAGITRLAPAALQSRKEAEAALAEAITVQGDPRRTPSLVDAATVAAHRARDLFRTALDLTDTDIREQDRKKQLASAYAYGSGTLSMAQGLLVRIDGMLVQRSGQLTGERAQELEQWRKAIDTAQRGFDRAHKQQNMAGMRQAVRGVDAARATLQGILETFGPLTLEDRGVPATLQEAVSLFLRGEHQSALTKLDATAVESLGAVALHAHLFRAAALYALFVQSGEKEADLRARATAAVVVARAQQPSFQPDPRVFNKRFIAFFRSGGAGAAPVEGRPRP